MFAEMRLIQFLRICELNRFVSRFMTKRTLCFCSVNHNKTKNSSMNTEQKRIEQVLMEKLSENDGFEWWPFKVGTYNANASENIRLHYDDDAMAVLVINNPYFFENAFRRWLLEQRRLGESAVEFGKRFGRHPIRDFFLNKFADIERTLSPATVKSICDFEPVIHRPPAVSLPICGRVSGATYFYPPKVVIDPKTNKPKPRMGLALHAKYGGHFALRGVIIFPDVKLPADFKEAKAVRTLKNEEEINEALELINVHWKDNRYRDCGKPTVRYSDLQLEYFNTLPRHRWKLLSDWFKD